jgi:hypothetical protein
MLRQLDLLREIATMLRTFAMISFALTLCGCSGVSEPTYSPDLVPGEGVVLIGDSPAADVEVVFTPLNAIGIKSTGITIADARSGYANTDAEGRFTLLCPPGGQVVEMKNYTGILPGEYVVSFHKFVMPDGSAFTAEMAKEKGPQASGARDIVPPQFGNPQTSPVKAKIGLDGATNLEFKIPAAK